MSVGDDDPDTDRSRFAAEANDIVALGRFVGFQDLLSDEQRRKNDLHSWCADNEIQTGPIKDEHYVIDICDRILRVKAERQARFPFLCGDPGKSGRRARLPVDALYRSLELVIEYHELQHVAAVQHFDKPDKLTVSGVHRGLQRKKYDDLRRSELPKQGLKLVVLSHESFELSRAGRLRRSPKDYSVVRKLLIADGIDLGYSSSA